MFGDLFNELIELLTVYTQQDPIRIGFVAIKKSHGFVSEVFIISISLVVGIDILQGASQTISACTKN
jgi:hypothetical protein